MRNSVLPPDPGVNAVRLTESVVDVLARLPTIEGSDRRAADTLFHLVIGRLRHARATGTYDVFEADPQSPRRRAALAEVLDRQFSTDPAFRESVAALVPAAEPGEPGAPRRARPTLRILVAGTVAAVVLGIGGATLATTVLAEDPRDGTTPCRTFFILAEQEQRALLTEVHRAHGHPEEAQGMYAVASVLYNCGQHPDSTVGAIVDLAR
ncbi:hypothetical protein L6E12_16945 [Actinokineospora sp. PR83]|uniref:hypothetical protein n=1 Tax=Actinokineospora sp. PR83 TaxID=2884908 RepID=UPI001F1D0B41|nr:hypothetical protein [Actinokineospora sp. PR83]MCG8917474.1 hypothetical protein [Actinokineospora sp. PR83]